MPEHDDTLPLAITLREVIAMQVLISSGERLDAEAIQSLNRKLDAQLDIFRLQLGTVRFGAVLKNAWRRAGTDRSDE
ncbi:MAG TPA: hypothetical protein VGP33_05695 [Chloroflexota bacterium]|jgi:hypothetical protein|nr:hypothetical protein [Chloroflexota bacterium]